MFTGIIENFGRVSRLEDAGSKLWIECEYNDLTLGESVAVNGACLTVVETQPRSATQNDVLFFVSPETLARTQLGRLKVDARVNLERAARVDTRLSGHWVQGHVDGLARLEAVTLQPDGQAFELRVALPDALMRYCVEKGSITLDGISLTINRVDGSVLSLMIIPHTWTHTTLSERQVGDVLNVEVDILAKLVSRQVEVLCKAQNLALNSNAP